MTTGRVETLAIDFDGHRLAYLDPVAAEYLPSLMRLQGEEDSERSHRVQKEPEVAQGKAEQEHE